MTDRPILFSAPMIRAILEGRKIVTRRIVKLPSDRGEWVPSTNGGKTGRGELVAEHAVIWNLTTGTTIASPYGDMGDRLWVRETWGYRGCGWSNMRPSVEDFYIEYQADGSRRTFTHPRGFTQGIPREPKRPKGQTDEGRDAALDRYWRQWRPSIFLPRWASRITLEITGIRVQRLHDISEEDARAEGAEPIGITFQNDAAGSPRFVESLGGPYRDGFRILWAEINGADSWTANPWVWVVSFKRVAAELAGRAA